MENTTGEVLRVRDWNLLFENNRTRGLKHLDWVPIQNNLDGDGYTELVDHPNGAAHLGAWLAIVQIASRCQTRGTLTRDNGRPHTAESLARISRIPVVIFEEALPRLLRIGWLEITQMTVAIPQVPAATPQAPARFPQDLAEEKCAIDITAISSFVVSGAHPTKRDLPGFETPAYIQHQSSMK